MLKIILEHINLMVAVHRIGLDRNPDQGRTQAGELQPPKPQSPENRNKNTNFVDIMISKVLRDFPLRPKSTIEIG
jgi:hypothetical protein